MKRVRSVIGPRAPSFCWTCNRMLQIAGKGKVHFNIVRDRDGVKHRVHNDCIDQSIADGCTFLPTDQVAP